MQTPIVRHFPGSSIGIVHQTGAQMGERHRGLTVELSLPSPGEKEYGFAEVYGGEYHAEIGLWFEGGEYNAAIGTGGKTLIDYDGVFELPTEVITMLQEAGYTVEQEEAV